MSDVDLTKFSEIRQRTTDMEAEHAKRNQTYQKYEDMYLMNWDQPNEANLKVTISPDPANAVNGALRLLLVTDPIFKFKSDKELAPKIEKLCQTMWTVSGKGKRIPIHYDALLSALLYAEMVIVVNKTDDMLKYAKKAKINTKRAEKLAEKTPFFFEVWNPRQGYPEFDSFGLSAYYRKTKIRIHEVKARFGDLAEGIWGEADHRRLVDLHMYYDDTFYAVWVDESPILLEPHGLPRIPISVTITEGSQLFEKAEDQRRPFLYTLEKTKLWERKNLALTVFFTKLFEVGLNPLFVHTMATMENTELDIDVNSGVLHLKPGEKFEPLLNKGVLDPSLSAGIQMTDNMTDESTMYKQSFGQPLGSTDTFSTINLLSQAGRLPLISPQRRGAWGIAEAIEIALDWYRDTGTNHPAFDIKAKDIPSTYELEVQLDVSLPQDKLQQANTATILKRDALASDRWLQENMLNMSDPDGMIREIWNEQAAKAMFSMNLQDLMQQAKQMAEAAAAMQQQKLAAQQQALMANQMPQGQPPQGPPQGPPQQGMGLQPPEVPGIDQGMAAGAQFPQGAPALQGMPSEAAGMLPGQGQAIAPDGEGMELM